MTADSSRLVKHVGSMRRLISRLPSGGCSSILLTETRSNHLLGGELTGDKRTAPVPETTGQEQRHHFRLVNKKKEDGPLE